MLYALATGFGQNPLDLDELRFVFEEGLCIVPTFPSVLAVQDEFARRLGIQYELAVHGEQSVILHAPLPDRADLLRDTHVVEILDKGADKGAVIVIETNLRPVSSKAPLVTITSTLFARGDGGFSTSRRNSVSNARSTRPELIGSPDSIDEFETRRDQALLYRLTGDTNPLHVDPSVAIQAGFDRPILHGLCTFGICCRAVLKQRLKYQAGSIESFHARFASPVFPGETVTTEIWGKLGQIVFQARVKERGCVVVSNGRCVLRA